MATILFQAAGASLGGLFGPIGAVIGRAAGALAGNAVDRALIGGRTLTGARLATARIGAPGEGAAIARVYGTMRVGGTLIWATRFEEELQVERSGAKAAGGNRVETYRYFGNFAFGLCEGPVAGIRRVYADGRELDLTGIELRLHSGTEDQAPDPLIEAKQGTGRAPAYRGLAYVVFERLPLGDFGNRIPVMQFEVMRPVGALERQIRAVTLIPGATEHGYATETVREPAGAGGERIINRHVLTAATDWQAALDELQALCPALERVALVVSWFGDDLRAGHCRIRPGVEVAARPGESMVWQVCGHGRDTARLVSKIDDGPAFGGTPNDRSVLQAIADLKARGLKVTLYPFLMMDIPPGNGLEDPQGAAEQPAFPWRGRITVSPAPGRPSSPDGTAVAADAAAAFLGSATAGAFDVSDGTPRHAGPDAGYRRMILHYALLAALSGGVDAFVIGSELKGLTRLRDGAGGFPFVDGLVRLSQEVRALLGAQTKLTYGADWSEYAGYRPQDGSGDHYFNLDPLWASPAIDAVGIDNYMPLADWRDDDLTAENPDGFLVADDPQALARAIEAGEGFDWYYANDAERAARLRRPITDGAAGKPWLFRPKDLEGWWANRHFERRGGIELAVPTAWTPRMKPIWFTELGCPAVDRGANQPNVFPDPKSAENGLPYFSVGARASATQRRFLEAHLSHWNADGRGMVDRDRIYLWSFDARPYPAFPANRALWRDGDNWATGHWLNGRLGAGTLADVIAAILTDHGFEDFDLRAVSGDLDGYVQGDIASARALIEPLMAVFQLDAIEDGGTMRFRARGAASLPARALDVLADLDDAPLWRETRAHEGDLADEAMVGFFDAAANYREASVRSRRVEGPNRRQMRTDLPAALAEETALAAAEAMLRDHRMGRRTLECAVAPQALSLEPGDVVRLPEGPAGRFLVTRIEDDAARRLLLREIGAAPALPRRSIDAVQAPPRQPAAGFAPRLIFADLPRLDSGPPESFARIAAFARPFRRMAVSASPAGETYRRRALIERPAVLGTLAAPLGPGPSGRLDCANRPELDIAFGGLSTIGAAEQLAGANRLALGAANGAFEILSFRSAEEIAPGRFRIAGLLRGLFGTEDAMRAGSETGADVMLLDQAVVPLGLGVEESGRPLLYVVEAADGSGATVPRGFAGGLRAHTPLAPVHLRALRAADGTICFTWVRRGRIDADDFDAVEIAMDEEREAYRLEILTGGVPVRTVDTDLPRYRYTPAEQALDLAATSTALAFRVRQIGRKIALGLAAETGF